MSSSHTSITSILPVRIPHEKCSCSESKEVTHVCLGCHNVFCYKCCLKHRQQLSAKSKIEIDPNDIIIQAIGHTSRQQGGHINFNPIQLWEQISAFRGNVEAATNDSVTNALQTLRKLIEERNDILIERQEPLIEARTVRDLKSYIEQNRGRLVTYFQARNSQIESQSTTLIRASINLAPATDWQHLITLDKIESNGKRKCIQPYNTQDLHFENLQSDHQPFKRLENLRAGNALAASDNLVIFIRNNDELRLVEPCRDHETSIPLAHSNSIGERFTDILDICWVLSSKIFVLLTENQVFTYNPARKMLSVLPEIQPQRDLGFFSCTYSDKTLLISFSNQGSPLQEWGTSSWSLKRIWTSSCPADKKIRCIRFSQSGNSVGIALSNNRKSDCFEVRDANTMQCIWAHEIPALPCIGMISLPSEMWLIGIGAYHLLFLMDSKGEVKRIQLTPAGKSSLRSIALVNPATVVMRTAETLIFFDLLR